VITIFIATAAAHPAAAAHTHPDDTWGACIVGLLLIAATLAARWHDAGLEER